MNMTGWLQGPQLARFHLSHLTDEVISTLMADYRKVHPGVMAMGEKGKWGGYYLPPEREAEFCAYIADPDHIADAEAFNRRMAMINSRHAAATPLLKIDDFEVPFTRKNHPQIQEIMDAIVADNVKLQADLNARKLMVVSSVPAPVPVVSNEDDLRDQIRSLEEHLANLVQQMNATGLKPRFRLRVKSKDATPVFKRHLQVAAAA